MEEKLLSLAIAHCKSIFVILFGLYVGELILRFKYGKKDRFYLNIAINLFSCLLLTFLLFLILGSPMTPQNFFVAGLTTVQLFKFLRDLLNESLDRLFD